MLISWFYNSFIVLNAQKTQVMYFGRGLINDASHPLTQPLMVKELTVETVFTFKYLGNVVDENLTLTDNVNQI